MKTLPPIANEPSQLSPAPRGCGVCGFAELRTDAVFDRGWVLLLECPRCTHRDILPAATPVVPLRAGGQPVAA